MIAKRRTPEPTIPKDREERDARPTTTDEEQIDERVNEFIREFEAEYRRLIEESKRKRKTA